MLLAKNKAGYHNLAMLSTEANTTGLYGTYARVGKELIMQYKDNLIALSGGLQGEVPQLILEAGEHRAEQAFLWWKEQFGDDSFVELVRHGLPEEDHVNKVLLGFARKYGVQVMPRTIRLRRQEDSMPDILLCIPQMAR